MQIYFLKRFIYDKFDNDLNSLLKFQLIDE